MNINTPAKLKTDSFYIFESHVGFDEYRINGPWVSKVEPELELIQDTESLFNYAKQILTSNTILVWFRGKSPIAFLDSTDPDFIRLDKMADLSVLHTSLVIEDTEELADGFKTEQLVCFVFPANMLNSTLAEIRATKPVAQQLFKAGLDIPSYRAMFNKFIALSDSNCLIALKKNEDGQPEIVDRLAWQSKESAFGFVLNTTTAVWQISIVNKQSAKALGLGEALPGTVVSKAKAAKLNKMANITRYFQSFPDFITVDKLNSIHGRENTIIIALAREAGLASYTIISQDQFEL